MGKLDILEELLSYPSCFLKAVQFWNDGNRNTLALAVSAICLNILDMAEDKAIDLITKIAEYKNDEEVYKRVLSVQDTYKAEKAAGCGILKGKNSNLALPSVLCTDICDFVINRAARRKLAKILSVIKPVTALKKSPSISWVVHNLFARAYVSILFGEGGIGKTWLILYLALKLSNGLNIWNDIPAKQAKVLLLEGDAPDSLLKERVEALGIDLNPDYFVYVNRYTAEKDGIILNLSTEEGRANLETIIEQSKPDLVIIDTLISFVDDEVKQDKIKPVIDSLRVLAEKHNCHNMVCHHRRKRMPGESQEKQSDQSDAIGSSVITRLVGIVFKIDKIYAKKGDSEPIENAGRFKVAKCWHPVIARFDYHIESDIDENGKEAVEIRYEQSEFDKEIYRTENEIVKYISLKSCKTAKRAELIESLGIKRHMVQKALKSL